MTTKKLDRNRPKDNDVYDGRVARYTHCCKCGKKMKTKTIANCPKCRGMK